jgi:hypothetical protein
MGNDLCPRRCLVRHALLADTFALMRLRIAAKSVAQDHGGDPSLTHEYLSPLVVSASDARNGNVSPRTMTPAIRI